MRIKAPDDRAVHLTTAWGVARYLKPGEEADVPDAFLPMARTAGCTILGPTGSAKRGGSNAGEAGGESNGGGAGGDNAVRAGALAAAIRALIERGNPEDFVKSGPNQGKPKVASVQAIVGFDVTAAEVAAAYEDVMADGNDGA